MGDQRKKNGCLPVVILLVALIAAVAAFGGNKDNQNIADSDSSGAHTELSDKEKAIASGAEVSWSTLCDQYKDNAIAADKAYKGKRLIVTGKVFDIGREVMQHPYITFSRNDYVAEFQMVFNDTEEDAIASLKKEQSVKIVGECSGEAITTVILTDCYLVQE